MVQLFAAAYEPRWRQAGIAQPGRDEHLGHRYQRLHRRVMVVDVRGERAMVVAADVELLCVVVGFDLELGHPISFVSSS
jgi:hypothetical protein